MHIGDPELTGLVEPLILNGLSERSLRSCVHGVRHESLRRLRYFEKVRYKWRRRRTIRPPRVHPRPTSPRGLGGTRPRPLARGVHPGVPPVAELTAWERP